VLNFEFPEYFIVALLVTKILINYLKCQVKYRKPSSFIFYMVPLGSYENNIT